MKRSATVLWNGPGKEGKGHVTTQSGALEKAHYAYNTRFEDQKGTNPEELIAAAHASCFSMKLSFLLNEAGYTADSIETTSTVTLDGGAITESHLDVKAKVPVISSTDFDRIAQKTKEECPVSKALNLKISMEAKLAGEDVQKELTI